MNLLANETFPNEHECNLLLYSPFHPKPDNLDRKKWTVNWQPPWNMAEIYGVEPSSFQVFSISCIKQFLKFVRGRAFFPIPILTD